MTADADLLRLRRMTADALTATEGLLDRLGHLRNDLHAVASLVETVVGEAGAYSAQPDPLAEATLGALTKPPAAKADVVELRVPGRRTILRPGDEVIVKPSRPRKRDGWRGTITALSSAGEVTVTCPGQSPRTVRVDRIGARKTAGQ